jgi:hypothetical protein
MHSVSPARSRSSSAIRSSTREVQLAESRDQLRLDLVQSEPDPLREDDEGDSAKHGTGVAAVARPGAFRADQAPILVEAKGGGRDAASLRHLADGEQVVDPGRKARIGLDFKLT